MRVEITYPCPNFNSATVQVWEWISKFILHWITDVITSILELKLIHVSKGGPCVRLWKHDEHPIIEQNWAVVDPTLVSQLTYIHLPLQQHLHCYCNSVHSIRYTWLYVGQSCDWQLTSNEVIFVVLQTSSPTLLFLAKSLTKLSKEHQLSELNFYR